MNMTTMVDISPTLKDIINLLDDHSQRSFPIANLSEESEQIDDAFSSKEPDFDSGIFGNHDTSKFDDSDETSVVFERSSFLDSSFQGYYQVYCCIIYP